MCVCVMRESVGICYEYTYVLKNSLQMIRRRRSSKLPQFYQQKACEIHREKEQLLFVLGSHLKTVWNIKQICNLFNWIYFIHKKKVFKCLYILLNYVFVI